MNELALEHQRVMAPGSTIAGGAAISVLLKTRGIIASQPSASPLDFPAALGLDPAARAGRAMNLVGSRIDAIAALKRRGAEMSVGIRAGTFVGHAGPISAVISAPESS